MKRIPTIAVSGGFDPIHKGHVQMIREAAEYGNVIVFLNSDDWLVRKKGYKFVCEAIRRHEPTYFANGGDRYDTNTPEMETCKDLGIQMLWNVGGGKIQSSSTLVSKAKYGRRVYDGQEF